MFGCAEPLIGYPSGLNHRKPPEQVLTLWSSSPTLQAESHEYGVRLAEQAERLQNAEKQSEERGQQVEELQRLLGSMEVESGILKDKMAEGELELLQLRADREEGEESEQR